MGMAPQCEHPSAYSIRRLGDTEDRFFCSGCNRHDLTQEEVDEGYERGWARLKRTQEEKDATTT